MAAHNAIVPVLVSTNYKGGVGKTTTSRVLAQGIAASQEYNGGKPVLVIDLDPQGNTSRRWQLLETLPDGSHQPIDHPDLADEDQKKSSICDLWLNLLGGDAAFHPVPYPTANPMIHVVPVDERQLYEAMQLPKDKLELLGVALRAWLRDAEMPEGERLVDRYSCVIIDTQPSKSPLINAALVAATHCYVPFIPEPQAIEGVYSIISYIHSLSVRRAGDVPIDFIGLLPNMVRKTRLHALHLRTLERDESFNRFLIPTVLSNRIGYAETDDWRNLPDAVTDLDGTSIQHEANKFTKFMAKRLKIGAYANV